MCFYWFVNLNSLFLRIQKASISSILLSKGLYETLPSESVYFVLLLTFQTVFSSVVLLSATNTGVCTLGHSGESEGIVEEIVWTVIKFCFCRNWQEIYILKTGITKLKTGCFGNSG